MFGTTCRTRMRGAARPDRDRRGDEVALAKAQHLAAYDPGDAGRDRDAEGDDDAPDARA